jgi:hypothetical protein
MTVYKVENPISVADFAVKYKDIFNMGDFYENLKDWLLEYGWKAIDARGNLEDNAEKCETFYLERIDARGAKEHFWWWRLQKIPGNNKYFKYHIDLDFHTLVITETEVMRDGKKFKANKGELEVKVRTVIEFDYTGEFAKSKLLKPFKDIFQKRIYKKDLETFKLELYREAYILQAFIKKWFKLKSFLPFEEVSQFYPSKAYPSHEG